MNNKGFIFTLDAIIALTIFIIAASAFLFFSNPIGGSVISSANVYLEAESVLAAMDKSETFSNAFYQYQNGNISGAQQILQGVLQHYDREAKLSLYMFNSSRQPVGTITVGNVDSNEKIVVRKYLAYTLTANLPAMNGTTSRSDVESTHLGIPTTLVLCVYNMDPIKEMQNVGLSYTFSDKYGNPKSWSTIPTVQTITSIPRLTPPPGICRTFLLIVPLSTISDEYTAMGEVQGDYFPTFPPPATFTDFTLSRLNILMYGIAELEVGI